MLCFERLQFLHELVIFGIADLRLVGHIVQVLMMAKLVAKHVDFAVGIFHRPLNYNLTRKRENRPIADYKNAVLIYNPRAGKFRNGTAGLDRAAEILNRAGRQVAISPTTGPRTAGAIASEYIARGIDLVIVAGGDGTINEAAEGMIGSDVPLAILPAGTANVLAMELGIGSKLERAAARLGELEPRRIAVGRITCEPERTPRHFLCMAGVGLDAQIVNNVNPGLKAKAGKFSYWLAGWSLLGQRLAQFRACSTGETRQCSFALLSRVRNYGGDFQIAPTVTLRDGNFEAVLFEGRTSLPYVKYFAGMALKRIARMKGVGLFRTTGMRFEALGRRVWVQVDGELAGHLPAEIRIVPDALTLLMPRGYGAP